MVGGRGVSALLLLHLNLVLALFAGAMLTSAARLVWDPSTYVAVRELWPLEYRAAVAMLTSAGAARLVLGHVAATAALGSRRPLLLVYVVGVTVLVAAQAAWACWTWTRMVRWLSSGDAASVQRFLKLKEQLKPVLNTLAEWIPLSERINELVQEAEADAPRNGAVAGAAVLVYAAAELAALVAASLMLRARPAPPAAPADSPPSYQEEMVRLTEPTGCT